MIINPFGKLTLFYVSSAVIVIVLYLVPLCYYVIGPRFWNPGFILVSNEDERASTWVSMRRFTNLDEMIAVKCPGLLSEGQDRTKRCDPGRGAKVMRWDGKRVMKYEEFQNGERYQMVLAESNFFYSTQLISRGWFRNAQGVRMKMISVEPRAFEVDVSDVITPEMRAEIISHAVGGMQRSMVGDANRKSHSAMRTSENIFDNTTEAALRVKRLAFEALSLEYDDSRSDMPQVVKYNPGQFYMPHHDYFYNPEPGPEHNKTNRMATLFVYLNDLEGNDPGGETIFPKRLDWSEMFGWNLDNFLGECVPNANNLKFRGRVHRALLFYSQGPNGSLDRMSEHAACPPLRGNTKWGVNIWVWNREFPKARMEAREGKDSQELNARIVVRNGAGRRARVYWHKDFSDANPICRPEEEERCVFVTELGAGEEIQLASRAGHVLHSYSKDGKGEYLESFRVGDEGEMGLTEMMNGVGGKDG